MSANPTPSAARRFWPPRPWHVLFVGLGVTVLGLLATMLGEGFIGLRFVLFLAGLTTAGAAVSLRLRRAGWSFEERMETAGMLAVAAFAALLALLDYMNVDTAWDSMQMALVALILVALLGVVLVLLPTTARMIAVGVLILVHFGAILSAATAVDPPNGSAPWLSRMAHQYVYRPYLESMYLNNAYHFYSPDPGPPALLWFHIKYQDGSVKWVKIPHRDDDPVPIHHTRLLSITESTSVLGPIQADYPVINDVRYRRERWGQQFDIEAAPDFIMPLAQQEQETQPYSQKMIESYVRHIAWTYPGAGVKGVKVYRLRHNIIMPPAVAQGRDPRDKTLFVAYYQGEYDKDGNLRFPDLYTDNGKPDGKPVPYDTPGARLVERKDAFRFWYIPVYYRSKNPENPMVPPNPRPQDIELVDCLTRHARFDMDATKVIDDPAHPDSPWDVETEMSQP